MADFCSKCSSEYFDINLAAIALDLERGHSINFLCEGCATRCIYKDEEGLLYIAFGTNNEIELTAIKIEEL